jgi:fructose/tagatose bisphosphate aldolase
MEKARKDGYAVGYFESWNLESLGAVADAAEAKRSPVILGFSGLYLPHPERVVRDRLSWCYSLGRSVCDGLSVPACLLFNESANRAWVEEAVALGFDLVMFSDEALSAEGQARSVAEVVRLAHARGVAVEGELAPLPGAGTGVDAGARGGSAALSAGGGIGAPGRGDDPAEAARFVAQTGVDALAVNLGQEHLHGRRLVPLDHERLGRLRRNVEVPLVLHGASSVAPGEIRKAVRGGICKINVGSVLKQAFFAALMEAGAKTGRRGEYNPYEVLGSGTASDVLAAARLAMGAKVEELMELFGSAGRASAG